ncbi:hypothetical protein GIB67_027820 [Kingdonia uniflora]|uniref:Always early n=1 Tax=Kingdonia uniflora TaxID=39325 RepID=A0A7J7MI55_9MAGN|nr:hypothetical protein GIB67_027820 [Kingdonia uniflora]
MMSTRKSRSVNKRFSKFSEESPEKDGSSGIKSKQQRKRKLSDMLGTQWSKEELEKFYAAYRKYGKEWMKVAGVVRNRSVEMVEALYNMNRAYLSLPEGTASVAGLIAMMTDHYNILEGSESDRESNDGPRISRKPQKRAKGKLRPIASKGLDSHVPDLLQSQFSVLKKRHSDGIQPRAVGKRTPRYPVSYVYGKYRNEKFLSSNKQGPMSEVDTNDDEVAHGAVMVLAGALQRVGSPQITRTPSRRMEMIRPPSRNRQEMNVASDIACAKLAGIGMDEDCLEGSFSSREAENGDFTEGFGSVEAQRKGKKENSRKPKLHDIEDGHFDDVREACSGTEEGPSSAKEKVETEVTGKKYGSSSIQGRKRSRQLSFDDERLALDALYTLADVSMKLAPTSPIDSDSSVQFKEDKITNIFEKSYAPEVSSASHHRVKPKPSGAKNKTQNFVAGGSSLKRPKMGKVLASDLNTISKSKPITKMRKGKRKSIDSKLQIPNTENHSDSHLSGHQKAEVPAEEVKKPTSKPKRIGQIASLSKQVKSARPEQSSSCGDPVRLGTYPGNHANLPTKVRSRRKMDLQKILTKESKSPDISVDDKPNKYHRSLHAAEIDLKEKVSRCLSSKLLRRWCGFEFFYSAIDYPWFAKNEFVDYLDHVGLGYVPRLTRVEWGVIRSSLGKPRRLSEHFIKEEKGKLEQYRESVRTQYTELRAGIREGLPADLARPLSVGQRVIACHPKTRELHDGSVLTVDRNRCRVQFDRPELGVAFVLDVDCMPLNPLENRPEGLRGQNFVAERLNDIFNEHKLNGSSKDWKSGGYMRGAPSENVDTAENKSNALSATNPINTLLKQAKGDTVDAISQAKAAVTEIANSQKVAYNQPCTLAQLQAKEADIRALSELTRALDKKESLVLELKYMNGLTQKDRAEEENHKNVNVCVKDSEPFKKQYGMVLMQLKEANDQASSHFPVSSALLSLRQRNTYQGSVPSSPWPKQVPNSSGTVGPLSSFDQPSFLPQESGPRVVEILESSKVKARTMVDAAFQAMGSLKEGEDAFAKVGEALDSANNLNDKAEPSISSVRSSIVPDSGIGNLAYRDFSDPCSSEPSLTVNGTGPKLNNVSEQGDCHNPSELISSCVATLLKIQACTERQYPPAEVAQILDSAVSSLQPCSSQNMQIYREIQMCMGVIKTQILALIPT